MEIPLTTTILRQPLLALRPAPMLRIGASYDALLLAPDLPTGLVFERAVLAEGSREIEC